MATAVWPATLPQSLPIELPERPIDQRVRFETEAGPGQVWALGTAEPLAIDVDGWIVTDAQRSALETFFKTTLGMGVLTFDWTDPWYGAGTVTFRFRTRPAYAAVVPAHGPSNTVLYRVSFGLESLPWFPPVEVTS